MLFYDEVIFQSFRSRAITKETDLIVGHEYFSNTWPERFVIKEITKSGFCNYPTVITSEGRNFCLGDMNVDMSHNPWMIFDNEETAKECVEKLQIVRDDSDWVEYDDPDYDDAAVSWDDDDDVNIYRDYEDTLYDDE